MAKPTNIGTAHSALVNAAHELLCRGVLADTATAAVMVSAATADIFTPYEAACAIADKIRVSTTPRMRESSESLLGLLADGAGDAPLNELRARLGVR